MIKNGEVHPEGCICEVSFGYNDKIEGYTNSSLDIPMLGEIARKNKNTTRKFMN